MIYDMPKGPPTRCQKSSRSAGGDLFGHQPPAYHRQRHPIARSGSRAHKEKPRDLWFRERRPECRQLIEAVREPEDRTVLEPVPGSPLVGRDH